VIAVARLKKAHGIDEAEFAMIVTDQFQGRGLGSELLRRLLALAKDEKVGRIVGDVLPTTWPMQHICEKAGFPVEALDRRPGG